MNICKEKIKEKYIYSLGDCVTKGRVAASIAASAFIILALVLVVYRFSSPAEAKTIQSAVAEERQGAGAQTLSAQIKPFTDESKLSFGGEKLSAVAFTSVRLELETIDRSVTPLLLKWECTDADAAEITADSDGKSAVVKFLKAGSIEIRASYPGGLYASCRVAVDAPKSHMIKNVPFITQNEKYPSGCESISTTMLLNYYGYDVAPEDFIDDYLYTGYLRAEGGTVVGPDPYTAFIGSPYDENSLGCYPPVIVKSLNKLFEERKTKSEAVDTTGTSLDELIKEYIINDDPVLVWSTMNLWQPSETESWTVDGAAPDSPYKDGDIYNWIANEHCLVMIGYDEDYYYFNDPLSYEGAVRYERAAFAERFEQIGRCSAAIEP